VIGRPFRELLPAASMVELETALARVRETRTVASFEYAVPGVGGEAAFETRVVPLLDDQAIVIVRVVTERRRAEASAAALARVGREIAGTLDRERAAQQIVASLQALFRVRGAVIYRVDASSGTLVSVAAAGDDEAEGWAARVVPVGQGVAGGVVASRQVVWSADVVDDPRSTTRAPTSRSVLGVPLLSRGNVIGAIVVADDAGRAYTMEERRLLLSFADQAAVALDNARLFEESERRRYAAEALAEVGRLVSESLEPAEVGERIVRALTRLFRAQMAVLYRVEPPTEDLVLLAGWGPRVDWNQRLARGTALVGRAVLERRPLTSPDILTDSIVDLTPDARARIERSGYRAVLAVPLVIRDRILGALAVGDGAGRIYDDEELQLVRSFADQAALALANAELYEQTRASLGRTQRLAELSQRVQSSLELQRVLDLVVEAALDLLSGDFAQLWLVDEKQGHVEPAASRAAGDLSLDGAPAVIPRGQGMVGSVIEERRPRSSSALANDPSLFASAWLTASGFTSYVAVPLVAGDVAMGALVVFARARRDFGGEDVELLQIFAAKAASALTNARLYREAQEAYEQLSRAQDLLMQAQKMDAVGRLAGGIAHDFNNLLTVIIARLDFVLEEIPADDRRRADVELVAGAAERASALTRQLLAFSRRQTLEPKIIDLNSVVRDVTRLLRRVIGENIELASTLASDLGHVRADPGQIEQVIVNLSVNARDAMPAGGTLTITTSRVEVTGDRPVPGLKPGWYVVLTMRDTGYGMDAETRLRAFEPFFTTKELGRGTGLGLATVYGIVKQHEGHIVVDSAPGKGTTFRIYLPHVDADASATTQAAEPPPVGWETVLLVEDEPEVRALVRQALAATGYRVIEARTPTDAVRIATDSPDPIHLLVTDVVMPEMGGRAVADAVSRLRPTVKTLFISGYTADAVGHFSDLEGPGRSFLEKPFTSRTLTRKVRDTLDRA
jgi:GAF domain-containing protein